MYACSAEPRSAGPTHTSYEELARTEEACDAVGKERAMKMLECMTEMILGKYRSRGNRGGKQSTRRAAGKKGGGAATRMGGVEYRVWLWEQGRQRDLMRMWRKERRHHARSLRKRATRGRAAVVGSKWDVEEMQRKLEADKIGDVMKSWRRQRRRRW